MSEPTPCRFCGVRAASEGISDGFCDVCGPLAVSVHGVTSVAPSEPRPVPVSCLCRCCGRYPQAPGRRYCKPCLTDYDAEDMAAQQQGRERAAQVNAEANRAAWEAVAVCAVLVLAWLFLLLTKVGPDAEREIARAEETMDAAGIVQVAGPRGNLE